MNKKNHTILSEKWRPDNLDGFICHEEEKKKFQEFIDNQDIPNILLIGRPGSGKTTLAKLLANNIDCDLLYINSADERSIDVMRDKVGAFASAGSFKPLKIVILDEFSQTLDSAQTVLLNMMETYSTKTRFILTGNYVERLIEPLRSRCQEFSLSPPSKKIFAKHLSHILDEEKIKYKIEDVVKIINRYYPDLRKIINSTQQHIIKNELIIENELGGSIDYLKKIIKELNNIKYNSINNIRQLIANNDIQEFTEAYRYLYNNLEEYSKGKNGEIIIKIEEYKYHSLSRIDQEICFMALISSILEIVNKKQII